MEHSGGVMTFLAVVIAFFIVQYTNSVVTLQSDDWYKNWASMSKSWFDAEATQAAVLIAGPLIIMWILLGVVEGISSFLLFLVSIPVLLYCLGRGDFSEWIRGYTEAYHRNDNEVASDYAERLGVDISDIEDWASLHKAVLQRAAYRGFERWFPVLFWFTLLGPLGGLLYRLTWLGVHHSGNSDDVRLSSARLLWLLEWPAVRLIGLTFCLVGNFVAGLSRWRASVLDTEHSSVDTLEAYLHGALSVNGEEITCESVSEQEIESLQSLLSRSLILWLCALAVLSVY